MYLGSIIDNFYVYLFHTESVYDKTSDNIDYDISITSNDLSLQFSSPKRLFTFIFVLWSR